MAGSMRRGFGTVLHESMLIGLIIPIDSRSPPCGNCEELTRFRAVYEHGSLSAAARALGAVPSRR